MVVGPPVVLPSLAIQQVAVAVAAAWLERDGGPPGSIAAAFKLDILSRPVVELPDQRHGVGMDLRRKSKGDFSGTSSGGRSVRRAGIPGLPGSAANRRLVRGGRCIARLHVPVGRLLTLLRVVLF